MKSYLTLIPIFSKYNKKESKMIKLCIILSVFLVTTIFNLAESAIKMEKNKLIYKHGKNAIENIQNTQSFTTIYVVLSILFILVLTAGILIISGSLNSTIAKRIKFFGMLRCIGMSKRQIIKFVRLESLYWCKTAIPIGIFLGLLISFILNFILKYIVAEEFTNIPIFNISYFAIISGVLVGLVTVLVSSSIPAKKASKISPIVGVSDNFYNQNKNKSKTKILFNNIEISLGISHVLSIKRNLFLMIFSFALSIILLLSFSVFINLVNVIMPQKSNRGDFSITSTYKGNSIDKSLIKKLESIPSISEVFGRSNINNITANLSSDKNINCVDLISFDNFDLKSLEKDKELNKGSDIDKIINEDFNVIATYEKHCPWKIGDTIKINDYTLKIVGTLKYDIFNPDGLTNGKLTIISNKTTFEKITNINNYSLVLIKLKNNFNQYDINKIKEIVGNSYILTDLRDQNTSGTYYAFITFTYSFIFIIAMVTALNIINSISISVSTRKRQYASMKAVGMTNSQILKMILSEAGFYSILGCTIGCVLGTFLNKWLYTYLITSHFQYMQWSFPLKEIIIITIFFTIFTIISVYLPYNYIKKIPLNEALKRL